MVKYHFFWVYPWQQYAFICYRILQKREETMSHIFPKILLKVEFQSLASKTSCRKKVFVNITLISEPMSGLALKIRRVKQKINHKTCKK